MQLHIGTKLINAKPMNRQEYNDLRDWVVPADENPSDDGFLVEYVDGGAGNHPDFAGYISWSPKEVFERAYKPVTAMNFGDAIVMLKAGKKVARAGWNGKGMFLYYVPANTYKAQTDTARAHFGEDVPYLAYIAMKTAPGEVVPWLASQTDVLAEDWTVVD